MLESFTTFNTIHVNHCRVLIEITFPACTIFFCIKRIATSNAIVGELTAMFRLLESVNHNKLPSHLVNQLIFNGQAN